VRGDVKPFCSEIPLDGLHSLLTIVGYSRPRIDIILIIDLVELCRPPDPSEYVGLIICGCSRLAEPCSYCTELQLWANTIKPSVSTGLGYRFTIDANWGVERAGQEVGLILSALNLGLD